MRVEISGTRCIGCTKYTQYYLENGQAVNHGFCYQRQCVTRPGSRCKHWEERSNVSAIYIRCEVGNERK